MSENWVDDRDKKFQRTVQLKAIELKEICQQLKLKRFRKDKLNAQGMWNEHDGFHKVKEEINWNRKKSSHNYYHRKLQKSGKNQSLIKGYTVFQEIWYKLLNRD